MGPSGSGKTTLLNTLARKTPTTNAKLEGEVLVNGGHASEKDFRDIASFVEQEDVLIGSLTVQASFSPPNSRLEGLVVSFPGPNPFSLP